MQCERCAGLMVKDRFLDMEEISQLWLFAWRCTNCGNVVDDQIEKHRLSGGLRRKTRASHAFPQQT